jgi:hypothetical protein
MRLISRTHLYQITTISKNYTARTVQESILKKTATKAAVKVTAGASKKKLIVTFTGSAKSKCLVTVSSKEKLREWRNSNKQTEILQS